MIAKLIAWSARNVLLVLIASLFAVAGGLYALAHLPLDAIPDLSDTQVIVYTEVSRPGAAGGRGPGHLSRSTTAMLTVPQIESGARLLVLRRLLRLHHFRRRHGYLLGAQPRARISERRRHAPADGVTPTLGPDATGVGWVYQYAITAQNQDLAQTRSIQDWTLRFGLAKAEGVAEVASVGGFVKQYNVVVDPQRMRDFGITARQSPRGHPRQQHAMSAAVRLSFPSFEFIVRGKGYLRGVDDLGKIVLKVDNGTPVLLRDVARIELGPDERRGITELNGEGEVASGIALQRFGSNALDVIDNVKQRMAELTPSLPAGTNIVPVYDRSNLIKSAIETLKHTLLEESLIVALVCIVFLLHIRSALVAILMLPVGILMAFGAMRLLGLGANIMSLGGIAIAIGAMIDGAIVMIENAHKHLERAAPGKPRAAVLIEAAKEVGPSLFFSLLVITVSFMPIFTLESQEGRLFGPLAFTKTFSMAAAAILSITLVPVLMILFVRGKIIPEQKNPINRALIWIYRPMIRGVLKAKIVDDPAGARGAWGERRGPPRQLGSEFMPNLNEGTLLLHADDAAGDLGDARRRELLQTQDRIIKSFPEVASVYGKAGRAETATDPAPSEMFETVVNLKPEERMAARHDDRKPHRRDGQGACNSRACRMPGPCRSRRASTCSRPASARRSASRCSAGTWAKWKRSRARSKPWCATFPARSSAYAERVIGGYYLDIVPDRDALARYGLMVGNLQDTIAMALGGETVTTTVEGRERYTVNVRYPRDLRSDPQAIARDVLVSHAGRRRRCRSARSPKCSLPAARPRSAPRTGSSPLYIYRRHARPRPRRLRRRRAESGRRQGQVSAGNHIQWSGQFEYLQRATEKLKIVVPANAADHLPAAVPQFRAADRNADRHAVAALRARRRPVADVVARVQHVGRGRGRLHRAGRRRRRNRRRHADLSRPGAERGDSGSGRPKAAPLRARTSTRRSCSAPSSACGPK